MATTSARRHLTDRDVEILQALDRCPLTVSQLLKLSCTFPGQPFTSIRSVQDRFQKLRHVGWLQSWPCAFPIRGGTPDYYRLTLQGFRLLHGENAPPPAKRHFSEISVARHHHTHGLAEFIVHTLTAAHRRSILLKHFYRENTLALPVDDAVAYPDSVFELHTRDRQQFNFLVELDNGTERIRSDKDTESWQKKIRLYNVLQDRNYPDRFRVLVVCAGCPGRLRSILELAAKRATNPQRALLYGVHLDDYLREPDALSQSPASAPYQITIDSTDAPELKDWVEKKLQPTVDKWYPSIARALPSRNYTAPARLTIAITEDYRGVAATAGNRVFCSADWLKKNYDGEGAGAVIHELVHVAQQYQHADHGTPNPGWLVEGVADYIRWFKYEPAPTGTRPRNLKKAKYTDSYRATAGFLNFVVEKHDKAIVEKLNAAMRQGKYRDGLWKELTGKTVDELREEYVATLQ